MSPAMNPVKWVRWKLVIVLGVVFGGLYFLGLNPIVRHEINSLGSDGKVGARFSVGGVGLGLTGAEFDSLKLATPQAPQSGEGKEKVAEADKILCALGVGDVLRKRFTVDKVTVSKPLVTLDRGPDGSINAGKIGQTEPQKPSDKKPTDWVKAAQDWGEKLKKKVEERQQKKAEEKKTDKKPEVAKKDTSPWQGYDQKAAYPYEDNPDIKVNEVSAEAVKIQLEDSSGQNQPPTTIDGNVKIENLSDQPEKMDQPTKVSITGTINGGGAINITGTIDLRKIIQEGLSIEKNDLLFNVTAKGVPMSVVQALAGNSIDGTFSKGTADLNAEVNLIDLEKLSIKGLGDQPLFSLHDVEMTAKPGSKIAGIDGQQFAQAVNQVGTLDVKGLEIGGTLQSPEFHWPDMTELLKSAAQAAGKKQLDKATDKAGQEAQKFLDKQIGKNPQAQGALNKLVPGGSGGAKDTVKKAAGGLFGNLLGGKKDETPPPDSGDQK